MKLFAIFYFTYIVLVDIIFCTSNGKSSFDSAENQFVYQYNDYPPVKTPNVKSGCFYFDENRPNCGFASDETRQKPSKVANRKEPNLMNLLQNELSMRKSKQTGFESDVNNLPRNEEKMLLTAEEPRFVIIRKENDFPLKIDSRNFWEFIPPRGKKDTLKWRDKKSKPKQIAFELNDDFYPVRGKKLTEIEDLFYPNRGKRFDK